MGEKIYIIGLFIIVLVFSFCEIYQYSHVKNKRILCTILSKDHILQTTCMNQPMEYVYADLMYKVNVKDECK